MTDTNDLLSLLPNDFTAKMHTLLGAEYADFLQAYTTGRYAGLRVNPLKTEREHLLTLLSDTFGGENLSPVSWEPSGLYYNDSLRPGKHPYHEAGLYYIQEPSAMSAAALLHPQPGERVLDLCAAPGGKSTQLAGKMNQQGLLVANEIHPARAKILSQNIERLGISNAIVTNESADRLAKRFPAYFHRILVDAPCSGEGMFRKNPDACAEWSLAEVAACKERSIDLLARAAEMLLPGGRIVYSTCTFAPEENEQTIAAFLADHPQFRLVTPEELRDEFAAANCPVDFSLFSTGKPEWANGEGNLQHTFRLWPHYLHGEGHFVAVLQNAADEDSYERSRIKDVKPLKDRAVQKVWQEFADSVFTQGMRSCLSGRALYLFGEQLYLLPEECANFDKLKVLRPGLHLGTLKKNRIEPSHALALFLSPDDVKNSVSYSGNGTDILKYLSGESLSCDSGNPKKGWCLICVDGFSIGWGKSDGGTIKNHYPKGLRRPFNG